MVQRGQQRFDPDIRDRIPERLAFAPKANQAFVAHAGKVLGAGRLGEAHIAGQVADRHLAVFDEAEGWKIEMVLENHAHADHLSAAPFIKAQTGAWIGIGAHIRDVQKIFRPVFAMDDLSVDGSDFDRLFEEGERLSIGRLEVEVMHVPGHTPADVAYLVGDAAFVGDTLFMPDYGTARADFPGGRRPHTVPLDPALTGLARRNATVPLP